MLNGPNDWDEWLKVIRNEANGAEIWAYIGPATNEDDELPVLEKSQLFSSTDIRAERAPLTVTVGATASFPQELLLFPQDLLLHLLPLLTRDLSLKKRKKTSTRRYTYKQDRVTYQQQKISMRSLLTTIKKRFFGRVLSMT